MRGWLGRLSLMVLSTLLTLLGIEVGMRVAFDQLPPAVQGEIQLVRRVPWDKTPILQPLPFITGTTFQAWLPPDLKDFRVKWRDADFHATTHPIWEGHPVGLRNEGDPQWPLDMVAFGDSFTFCWTEVEDCWVQVLAADYGWHTVNAGLPGTGSAGQVDLMEWIAPPLQPKFMVWQWYGNDISDDYVLAWLRGETPALDRAPGPDPALQPSGLAQYSALVLLAERWLNPPPSSDPYEHIQTVKVEGRRLLITTTEYPHPYSPTYPAIAYGWGQHIRAHEKGQGIADDMGVPLLIVLIPDKEEVYAEALTPILGAEYIAGIGQNRRAMMAECATRGWHCLDLLETFTAALAEGAGVYYNLDFHLAPDGNRIMAQAIAAYVAGQGWRETGN